MDQLCTHSASSAYTAAVSLNNIAVTLLERKASRHAATTLREALSTIRTAFIPTESKRHEVVSTTSSGLLKNRIERAEDRIVRQIKPFTGQEEHYYNTFNESMLLEETRSMIVDGNLSFLQDTVPIRIDERIFSSANDRDFDIESMIILYNFGIAHLHLLESHRFVNAAKIQELAYRFFKMASSVKTSSCDRSEIKAEKLKLVDEKRIILTILALKNLIRLQHQLGKRSEAIESCQKLSFFRSAITERSICNEEIKFLSPAA